MKNLKNKLLVLLIPLIFALIATPAFAVEEIEPGWSKVPSCASCYDAVENIDGLTKVGVASVFARNLFYMSMLASYNTEQRLLADTGGLAKYNYHNARFDHLTKIGKPFSHDNYFVANTHLQFRKYTIS